MERVGFGQQCRREGRGMRSDTSEKDGEEEMRSRPCNEAVAASGFRLRHGLQHRAYEMHCAGLLQRVL